MELKTRILHEIPDGVSVIVVSRGKVGSPVPNITGDKAYLVDRMSGAVKECLRRGYLQYVADRARGKAPYLSLEILGDEEVPVAEPNVKEEKVIEEEPQTILPTAEVERPAVKPKKAKTKVVKHGVKRKSSNKRSDKN